VSNALGRTNSSVVDKSIKFLFTELFFERSGSTLNGSFVTNINKDKFDFSFATIWHFINCFLSSLLASGSQVDVAVVLEDKLLA
jgi:hypothetical protein